MNFLLSSLQLEGVLVNVSILVRATESLKTNGVICLDSILLVTYQQPFQSKRVFCFFGARGLNSIESLSIEIKAKWSTLPIDNDSLGGRI